jgi:hypothetical protein
MPDITLSIAEQTPRQRMKSSGKQWAKIVHFQAARSPQRNEHMRLPEMLERLPACLAMDPTNSVKEVGRLAKGKGLNSYRLRSRETRGVLWTCSLTPSVRARVLCLRRRMRRLAWARQFTGDAGNWRRRSGKGWRSDFRPTQRGGA